MNICLSQAPFSSFDLFYVDFKCLPSLSQINCLIISIDNFTSYKIFENFWEWLENTKEVEEEEKKKEINCHFSSFYFNHCLLSSWLINRITILKDNNNVKFEYRTRRNTLVSFIRKEKVTVVRKFEFHRVFGVMLMQRSSLNIKGREGRDDRSLKRQRRDILRELTRC